MAGILERNGLPIRYYRNDDREVEFLVEIEDGDGLLASPEIPYGYKFVDGNVGVLGKKITLPHYLSMFLRAMKSAPEILKNRE